MVAIIQKMPEQVKLVGDGIAFFTSIAAIAGWITTVAGAIGAVAAAIWGIYRAINEYKTYKNRK